MASDFLDAPRALLWDRYLHDEVACGGMTRVYRADALHEAAG